MPPKGKKKSYEIDIIPESDDFSYGTHPRKTIGLVGHHKIAQKLCDMFRSGNTPQNILFTGPRSIGKATLTYHIIRALERYGTLTHTDQLYETTKDSSYQKLSSLSLPNLKVIRRGYNYKTGKFYQNIRMEDIKPLHSFFTLSSPSEGYRYCIIDCVDDMMHGTLSVPNALLKTLEEPPKKTLFFLLAHQEGNLLPTIKSRCMHLKMSPLSFAEMKPIWDNIQHTSPPKEEALKKIFDQSSGSMQYALILSDPVWNGLYNHIKKCLFYNISPKQGPALRPLKEKLLQNTTIFTHLSSMQVVFLSAIHGFIRFSVQENKDTSTIYHALTLFETMRNLYEEAGKYNFITQDTLESSLHLIQHYQSCLQGTNS